MSTPRNEFPGAKTASALRTWTPPGHSPGHRCRSEHRRRLNSPHPEEMSRRLGFGRSPDSWVFVALRLPSKCQWPRAEQLPIHSGGGRDGISPSSLFMLLARTPFLVCFYLSPISQRFSVYIRTRGGSTSKKPQKNSVHRWADRVRRGCGRPG